MSTATTQRDHTRLRLAPSPRRALLTLHTVVAVGLLGDSAGFLAIAIRAAATDDPQLAASSYELLRMFSYVFGIPLSFATLVTGAALGLTSKWGHPAVPMDDRQAASHRLRHPRRRARHRRCARGASRRRRRRGEADRRRKLGPRRSPRGDHSRCLQARQAPSCCCERAMTSTRIGAVAVGTRTQEDANG